MRYTITFYTYWHCGSGLSGGSSTDAEVVKDDQNLPFVPGRTVKGHLREAAKLLGDEEFVTRCFGDEDDKPGLCRFDDAVLSVELSRSETKYLYHRLSATKIDPESGTAEDKTLRTIEAVVPVTLHGRIGGLESEEDRKKMIEAMRRVKRIGLRRHRGLGRCDIRPAEGKGEEE